MRAAGLVDGTPASPSPKPYKLIGFGDIHGPKPYKFIGLADIHGPKPYKFIGFGNIHGPKPYKFMGFGVQSRVRARTAKRHGCSAG